MSRKGEEAFLVLFEDAQARRPRGAVPAPAEAAAERRAGDKTEIVKLRRELVATREYLQSVIEQQEAANEELQSANEEVQSANEELQSINEELETSKEEIQSSNEELATVNDELHHRNLDLTRSNNDFVNLLSSVQMAIVMLGPDLRIRRFTPEAEKLLNLLPSDVGRPFSNIKFNVAVDDLDARIGEVIASVSAWEQEVQDRQGRWYLLRLRPYRTMDHRIDGAVVVLVDIDAMKRGQAEQHRQAELLEQTYEPVVIWELDSGTITFWNRGAQETYGHAPAQALGRSHTELLGTAPQAVADIRLALQADGHWLGEQVHNARDGRRIDVESRMTLVQDPVAGSLVIETSRPIGARKQLETTLRAQAAGLEEADRNRNAFLAALAHELRNPLAALRNIAQTLNDPRAVAKTREIMNRQIQNMARMIDDLLDVARIAQGTIEIKVQPVDLGALLRQVADASRPSIEARGQKLTLALAKEPLFCEADEGRLDQVFRKLLHNASRFSNAGGHLWLTSELITRRDEPTPSAGPAVPLPHARITIRDDGVGMGPAFLPRVFDLFAQAERSPELVEGGLGAGLTLVRRVVELHGGTVEATSAGMGMGSEFIVRLPAREAPKT